MIQEQRRCKNMYLARRSPHLTAIQTILASDVVVDYVIRGRSFFRIYAGQDRLCWHSWTHFRTTVLCRLIADHSGSILMNIRSHL